MAKFNTLLALTLMTISCMSAAEAVPFSRLLGVKSAVADAPAGGDGSSTTATSDELPQFPAHLTDYPPLGKLPDGAIPPFPAHPNPHKFPLPPLPELPPLFKPPHGPHALPPLPPLFKPPHGPHALPPLPPLFKPPHGPHALPPLPPLFKPPHGPHALPPLPDLPKPPHKFPFPLPPLPSGFPHFPMT